MCWDPIPSHGAVNVKSEGEYHCYIYIGNYHYHGTCKSCMVFKKLAALILNTTPSLTEWYYII